jgi:hypothetical protein
MYQGEQEQLCDYPFESKPEGLDKLWEEQSFELTNYHVSDASIIQEHPMVSEKAILVEFTEADSNTPHAPYETSTCSSSTNMIGCDCMCSRFPE